MDVVTALQSLTSDSVHHDSGKFVRNIMPSDKAGDQGKEDLQRVTKAVDEINKRLESASTQITFFYDTESSRIWLNVVDKSTGKVVSEIPPESIRKIVDSYSTSGLNVDKFR